MMTEEINLASLKQGLLYRMQKFVGTGIWCQNHVCEF